MQRAPRSSLCCWILRAWPRAANAARGGAASIEHDVLRPPPSHDAVFSAGTQARALLQTG
eukprot:351732-Chlamydomonas_euryale.AAC.1